MKRRVTLRVESLDGRILPSGSPSSVSFGHQTMATVDDGGSKPGATGEGIQVSGSKPVADAGGNLTDIGTPVALFGSKPVTNAGSN